MDEIFSARLANSEAFAVAFDTALDKLETNGVLAVLQSLQEG